MTAAAESSHAAEHHGLFQDTNLHVDDTGGSGRPVVLIHGWPLSGESFQEQIQPLVEAGHRVITYDRRGFGRSGKPESGYEYDTLAADLHELIEKLDLREATIVGFSMGGGEVARYLGTYGSDRIRSAVFASAVPPYMLKTDDNPEGPLEQSAADEMAEGFAADRDAFFDQFTTAFFSAGEELKVTEAQRQQAIALAKQSSPVAAAGCMEAFGATDFRGDLAKIDVPVLILHGDADGPVPFEGSGARTHEAIPGSEVHLIHGAPHGANVSHAEEWNSALIEFLKR